MENITYLSSNGVNQIHACIWLPEGTPKGVVQIIHGMSEYAARYGEFAHFLAKNGYAVCAEDHLGHGESVLSVDDLGYFDKNHDYKTVLADIHALHQNMQKRYPGIPYFVLGHSMGSFFCRNYIALYGSSLNGAVIMGTGFKSGALMATAKFLTRLNAMFCGWRNRSKFIYGVAFGSYNKRFKADGDANSWLSRNAKNVVKYNADPLCGTYFTDNGYYVLFSVIQAACKANTIKAVSSSLPVYFVSGAEDPVGDYGKGVQKAYDKFKKAGVEKAEIKLYQGDRHEILNEDDKDAVMGDLLSFFDKNTI